MSYPGAANTLAKPGVRDIHVSFGPLHGARAASAADSSLTAGEWLKLIARLGEIPDPTVASAPSSAAIPDKPAAQGQEGGQASGNN
jgi:hypothetical protein